MISCLRVLARTSLEVLATGSLYELECSWMQQFARVEADVQSVDIIVLKVSSRSVEIGFWNVIFPSWLRPSVLLFPRFTSISC